MVKVMLYFRRTRDTKAIVAASIIFVLLTNIWVEVYGGRIKALFSTFQVIFNIIPLVIFVGYMYLENLRIAEKKEKERIKSFFQKYVSQNVVNEIIEKGVTVSGERREISVLFTDIRGFTSLTEKTPPEEVVSLLNSHFNILTKIVFSEGGTVNKFIGDSVMVIFGAPIAQEDHVKKALKCAIKMQNEIKKLKKVKIGISINSGEAIVGNVGSEEFVDYTAIGDVVNTASRLQAFAGPEEIVISESTYKMLIKSGERKINS
jgi:adenylate cyclase